MNSRTPEFSILLTTYNRASLIADAIRSVLNQTCTDFELIILDDCSPDNTAAVVRSFHDRRIIYVRNTSNLGFSANFKNGMKRARGIYIFLLSDDDCIMRTDTLETVRRGMDQYHAGVGSMSLMFYETDLYHPAYYIPVSRKTLFLSPSPANIYKTRKWHFGFMSGNIYRRSQIRLSDIGSDLWVAHLKPLWRSLVADGCVYFGEHFIIAKISTSGNIAHLDLKVNKGYFLRTQLAMYKEFDPSPERYKAFEKFHIDGVCQSFFGIKYFSSNTNLILIAKELITIDPSRKSDLLFWCKIGCAILIPKHILRVLRYIKLRINMKKTKQVGQEIRLAHHLDRTRAQI